MNGPLPGEPWNGQPLTRSAIRAALRLESDDFESMEAIHGPAVGWTWQTLLAIRGAMKARVRALENEFAAPDDDETELDAREFGR